MVNGDCCQKQNENKTISKPKDAVMPDSVLFSSQADSYNLDADLSDPPLT